MEDWLRGVVADKVLHKVLGKFVSGIDKDALDLDLGMGDISLHSLALNLETFEALDLPFHVAGGTLGQVRVKVPWRNITNEPTKIVIDRVYLLLSPKDASPVSADAREAAAAAAKREFLEGWEAQQERKREQKQGFGAYVGEQVEKLVRSILQKLQISITNVHVRIQQGEGAGGVAAGVCVRSIQVTDLALADAGSARQSSDTHLASMLAQLVRKSVRIEGLAVYLSGGASGGASGDASGEATHTDRAAWERLMVPMLEARSSLPDHILPPLDVKLEVEFDPAGSLDPVRRPWPKLTLRVEVENTLAVRMRRAQLGWLLELVETIARMERRHRFLRCRRPVEPPRASNASSWWAYAVRAVISKRSDDL